MALYSIGKLFCYAEIQVSWAKFLPEKCDFRIITFFGVMASQNTLNLASTLLILTPNDL